MTPDQVQALPPYGHAQTDKEAWLLGGLKQLTRHHRAACPPYDAWVRAMFPPPDSAGRLADLPWLPVGVFKSHLLRSVPEEAVVRVLTSSGTSGGAVSRIALDAATAGRQGRVLAAIMRTVLGPRRLPMLIVDSPTAVTGAGPLSARGAGILGMMPFGHDHTFLLDDALAVRTGVLAAFLDRHGRAPFLIFGMTAMVWTHLLPAKAADLANGVLIHGGGWKSLEERGVDNDAFKETLKRRAGLSRVINFYGMAEQVGSVLLEGEDGRLHPPATADVIIRDPASLNEVPTGTAGLIQVVSLLPTSYPGHSILTEDWGRVDAIDAGTWKGKSVTVLGRVKQAELRGCGDILAGAS